MDFTFNTKLPWTKLKTKEIDYIDDVFSEFAVKPLQGIYFLGCKETLLCSGTDDAYL